MASIQSLQCFLSGAITYGVRSNVCSKKQKNKSTTYVKKCNESNCDRPVFSHGFCRYHQYKRNKVTKPKESKANKARSHWKQGFISPISNKRRNERILYINVCKEKEAELRAKDPQKKIYCFFSGKEIPKRISWHHWYGRDNDNYTNKAGLVPTINENHLMYHDLSVEQLEKKEWYNEFLERLKIFDISLFEKQVYKKQKSE